jgi:hypothetical protein
MMLEMANVRWSENNYPCFTDWTGFPACLKRLEFRPMDLLNMIPQFVDPAQRFRSFLIGLGHVTDAKEALGRLAFLENCLYPWRFRHEMLLRCRRKPTPTLALLSVLPPDPESDALQPADVLLIRCQLRLGSAHQLDQRSSFPNLVDGRG